MTVTGKQGTKLSWRDCELIGTYDKYGRWWPDNAYLEYFTANLKNKPSKRFKTEYLRAATSYKFARWMIENHRDMAITLKLISNFNNEENNMLQEVSTQYNNDDPTYPKMGNGMRVNSKQVIDKQAFDALKLTIDDRIIETLHGYSREKPSTITRLICEIDQQFEHNFCRSDFDAVRGMVNAAVKRLRGNNVVMLGTGKIHHNHCWLVNPNQPFTPRGPYIKPVPLDSYTSEKEKPMVTETIKRKTVKKLPKVIFDNCRDKAFVKGITNNLTDTLVRTIKDIDMSITINDITDIIIGPDVKEIGHVDLMYIRKAVSSYCSNLFKKGVFSRGFSDGKRVFGPGAKIDDYQFLAERSAEKRQPSIDKVKAEKVSVIETPKVDMQTDLLGVMKSKLAAVDSVKQKLTDAIALYEEAMEEAKGL